MLTGKKLIEGVNLPRNVIGAINSDIGSKGHSDEEVDSSSTHKLDRGKNYQLSPSSSKVDSQLTAKLTHCRKCKSRVHTAWKACPDCGLSLATTLWDATAWQEYFDERATTTEHEGDMSHDMAVSMAYETCISHWINKNPPIHNDPSICPQCHQAIGINALAVLTGNAAHLWLHSACHASWLARRQQEAVAALAKMDIKVG